MQLAEYIGLDYVEAVENGKVIDDAEYEEMVDFSVLLVDGVNGFDEEFVDLH